MTAPAECPHLDHAGSRVVRNGVYGPSSRQRYRCQPAVGKPHTFSAPVDLSTRPAGGDPGSGRLRSYRYDVSQIATALVSIGRGASYRQAAIRASAGSRINSSGINGQLVANWVRAFGPVVAAPHEPNHWPPVLGVGAFTLRHGPATDCLVIQLAVAPASIGHPPRLWDARLATRGDPAGWAPFFERGSGRPHALIVGRDTGAATVAMRVWADRPPRLMEWRHRTHPGAVVRMDLVGMALAGTDAVGADSVGTKFGGTGSVGTDSVGTESVGTEFGGAQFGGAEFAGMALAGMEFAGADVAGADVVGADAVDKLVTMLAEARDALVRRLGTRQAQFRSHDQLGSLLRLMRIDVNGDADAVEYAERILAAGAAA